MSDATNQQSYLVEHYRPGFSASQLEEAASRVRDAVRELQQTGEPVRFRHATIVASDESFLCVVDAPSEELVRVAHERASVPFERISVALAEE